MPQELEEALVTAAAKGLTHFSIWPVNSHDSKKTYWRAQAAPSTGHSYVSVTDVDPIKAMVLTLQALPAARKRRAPSAQKEMDVTATVAEPEAET